VLGERLTGFAYSNACDEAASINLTEATTIGEKDDDSKYPQSTKMAGGPQTINSVRDEECEKGASDAADLHHGRNISLTYAQATSSS